MVKRTAVALLALGILVGTALPAQASIVRIDRARARGDYATTIADGDVNNPRRIWVTIKARPNQHADGNYTMTCSKGPGAGSKDGKYSGTTPYRRVLKMPYRRPDECSVAALGSLGDSGTIIVILTARV